MRATIIRIPDEEIRRYKEIARERGDSLAEFFRKAARKEAKIPKKKSKYSFWDIGTKIVSNVGPRDGSINHDKYLYEFEEAKMKRYWRKLSNKK